MGLVQLFRIDRQHFYTLPVLTFCLCALLWLKFGYRSAWDVLFSVREVQHEPFSRNPPCTCTTQLKSDPFARIAGSEDFLSSAFYLGLYRVSIKWNYVWLLGLSFGPYLWTPFNKVFSHQLAWPFFSPILEFGTTLCAKVPIGLPTGSLGHSVQLFHKIGCKFKTSNRS